jgi:thioesterase domain-containing protein/acyl carrier protein
VTTVLASVEEIFRDLLSIEPPTADTDLVATGLLDSLMLITLLAELEVKHSISIPLEELDLEEIQTLARLAALVARLSASESVAAADHGDELLVLLRRGTSEPPVFLMPNVMGAALALRPLAFALETTRPIYALGDPSGCVIAGVSFGGLVAYETARCLQQAGEPVARVILLDARPAARSLGRGRYWGFRLVQPLRAVYDILPDLRRRVPDVIRRVGPQLAERLRQRLRSAHAPGGAPQWSTLAHQADQAYRPGHYDGSATLFVTDRPPLSTFRPETVWSHVIDGDLSVERIPGTHLNFLRGEWLDGMAERLSRVIQAL